MNLFPLLVKRESAQDPIRVGIIGAGKFATMFMSQIIRTPGMSLDVVCDLDVERAQINLLAAGFEKQRLITHRRAAPGKEEVLLTSIVDEALNPDLIDVVIESTGDPIAGARHALTSIELGIDTVMVNVEADVLVGPLLAKKSARTKCDLLAGLR